MSTSAIPIDERGADRKLLRRILRDPLAVGSVSFLILVIVAAILAPVLSPFSPNDADLARALAPMSAEHPLGTDSAGRDVLSRLLHGAQFSLAGAGFALVVALVIGVPSGVLAGYYPGWFDQLSNWMTNLLMALPGMIVLLAVRAAVGPSMWISMGVFGVLLAPSFYRLVQASVRGVRDELYIDAARVTGLSDMRIMSRHVIGVVKAPIIIQAAIVAGGALAIQAGLDFLGLGDQTIPTWGTMLNEAYGKLNTAPQLILWPAAAIALTTAACVFLASGIRDALSHSASPAVSRQRSGGVLSGVESPAQIGEAAPDSALLSVRGISVSYGRDDHVTTVVHDVTFHVERGEVVGLVGESGSGKSQTAFSVLGLLPRGGRVSAGSIRFDGNELVGLDARGYADLRGSRIAYVPQEPMSNLDPSFTVGSQMIEMMRTVLGVSRREARDRAVSLLDRVGIVDPERVLHSYPHQISGGMAQRVLIAQAISCEPELIIADEPTTALDVTVQAEILDLLRDLQRERAMALVLVTHNLGVVADLCDRVIVMRQGRVVETQAVDPLFSNPQHPYTQMLLASTLDNAAARPALGERTPRIVASRERTGGQ